MLVVLYMKDEGGRMFVSCLLRFVKNLSEEKPPAKLVE